MTDLEKQLNAIEAVQIEPDGLAAFETEEDFTGISVDLLVEVGSYVCVAACLLDQDTKRWDRNQAIIGGNFVRLHKLICALLDQTCQRRRETSFILARLAFENVVNITFLIERASPDLFDSYVRYSLRHEKKLYDSIHKNIVLRGGEKLPIEERMLSSIERTAMKSKLALADVSSSKPKNWGDKNLFERSKEVGLEEVYLAAFGGTSHSVHGNWMDLLEYHLEEVNGGFEPQLEWHPPRPQVLLVIALLVTEATGKYFGYLGDEVIAKRLDGRLADLLSRIRQTDKAHERFLASIMEQNISSR